MANKKHKLFSASSSERWMGCPASALFTKDMVSKESPASVYGSAGHWLAEITFKSSATSSFIVDIDEHEAPDERFKALVDDEMCRHVDSYITQVRAIQSQNDGKLMVEVKCPLTPIHEDAGGTSDAIILEPWGSMHVMDLKLGKSKVEAQDNSQGACYALGAAYKCEWDFDKAFFHIVQPRRDHYDVCEWDKKELKDWEEKIRVAIKKALEPDAPFIPGEWCHFCPGKLTCPALNKAVMPLVDKLPTKELSPKQIGDLLSREDAVLGFFKELNHKALQLLEKGVAIPGFKLVDKRGVRTWKDQKALEKFLMKQGYEADDVYESKLKSPAQLEKVIGKKLVDKHCVYISSGNTIAPIKDKRSEARSSVEKDFEGF